MNFFLSSMAQHEKITLGTGIGLALALYQTQETALPLIHKVYPFVSLPLSSCWTLVMKCVATVPFTSMALLIWELEIQKPFESISLFFLVKFQNPQCDDYR